MTESSAYLQLPQEEEAVASVEEATPVKTKTLDDLAKMGRYAFLVMLFSEFTLLQGAGNMVYMIFAGAAPSQVSCIGDNYTIPNICAPGVDPDLLSNCRQVVDYEFKSVNVEFGLFCKDGAQVKRSISIQMTGVLIGTVLCGMLSDMFGRLRVLSLSFLFSTLFGIACAFPPNLTWFTIMRAIQGPFTGGLIGTFLVYMTEQIPKKHRFTVSSIIAWSLNYILVAIMAYYSGDWRTFQLNILIASSPAFFFYWFVYESPRWLVQHGRLEEAREILEKIQARDGEDEDRRMEIQKLLDVEYQAQHARSEEKKKKINVMQLFTNRKMTFYVGVVSLGVFITSMTNYALAFNLDKLSGSIFINSLSLGFFRWTINLLCGFLDYRIKWLGRKCVHLVCQGLTGVAIGVIAIVYLMGWAAEYATVIRIATIMATSLSTQVFITKSVVTMELFPTLLRNQAMSFKSVFSRFGIIVAPQVFVLSPWLLLPYAVLSTMILFDTVIFQASLPETKGTNLPDRIQEVEEVKRAPLIKSTV